MSISVPATIQEQQQVNVALQASLIEAQELFALEEVVLSDNLAGLDYITDDMLKTAAHQQQVALQKIDSLRLQQQDSQIVLDTALARLMVVNKHLDALTQYPLEELTVLQHQQISEAKEKSDLQQQYVDVAQHHLDIITALKAVAIKQADLTMVWHLQLQTSAYHTIVQKQENRIVAAQTFADQQNIDLEKMQKKRLAQIEGFKNIEVSLDIVSTSLKQVLQEKAAAEMDHHTLKLEHQNITDYLEQQLQNLQAHNHQLTALKTSIASPTLIDQKRILAQEQILKELENTVSFQQQILIILNQRIAQVQKQVLFLTEGHAQLQTVFLARQKMNLEDYLQKEQERYLAQVSYLRWELHKNPSSTRSELLKIQIQERHERYQQAKRHIEVHRLQKQIALLERGTDDSLSREQLDKLRVSEVATLNRLLNNIHGLYQGLQEKIAFLEIQHTMLVTRDDTIQAQNIIATLKDSLQQERNSIPALQAKGQKMLNARESVSQEAMFLGLWVQRQFPTDTAGWQYLWTEMTQGYTLFKQQFQQVKQNVIHIYQQIEVQHGYTIISMLLIWLFVVISVMLWLGKKIKAAATKQDPLSLFKSRLLRLNPFTFLLVGVVLILLTTLQADDLTVSMTLIILGIGVASKLLLNFFWIWLGDLEPKIYRKIRWRVLFLGFLSIITALLHVAPQDNMLVLSTNTVMFIDSIFMTIFILLVIPLLQMRHLILTYLRDRMGTYWRLMISFITLFIPLVIFAISTLAVMGYVSFAWFMVEQMSLFLFVLIVWLLSVSIVANWMNAWTNFLSHNNPFQDLWRKDIIPLVKQVCELMLFVLAIFAFVKMSAFHLDLKALLVQWLALPLFTFGELDITLPIVLLVIFIVWFSNWIRGVTQRWAYIKVSDVALRTSMSELTQYVVLIFGLLIVLKVLGFHPITLAVFAGTVGVGLAFGLQNILAFSIQQKH